jgi:hypothetical protein
VSVEVADGRASVEAEDALALAVLERLGERAGFRVAARTDTPRRVSLRLDGVTLEHAIAVILAETPYGIDYRYDAAKGAHAIETVRVGSADSGSRSAALGEAERGLGERLETRPPSLPPAAEIEGPAEEGGAIDLAAFLARRRALEDDSGTDPEVIDALLDPRDSVRAEAVGALETEGVDLQTAIAFAKADPSPRVRAAAVDALGEDGRYAAMQVVVKALDDPDPTVVLRAIAVIESEGDATLASRLEPLAQHRDDAVRARVAEALAELR